MNYLLLFSVLFCMYSRTLCQLIDLTEAVDFSTRQDGQTYFWLNTYRYSVRTDIVGKQSVFWDKTTNVAYVCDERNFMYYKRDPGLKQLRPPCDGVELRNAFLIVLNENVPKNLIAGATDGVLSKLISIVVYRNYFGAAALYLDTGVGALDGDIMN